MQQPWPFSSTLPFINVMAATLVFSMLGYQPVGLLFLVHRHSSVPVPCFVLLLVAAGRWHEIYTTYIMLGVIVPCRGGEVTGGDMFKSSYYQKKQH